jgi:hypothetical protein
MGILRTNTLSGIGTDGPVFDGVTRFDTQGYFVPPVGVTSDRTAAGITTSQGAIRFNTDSQKLEFYAQDQWWEMVIDTPALGVGSNTGAGARGLFGGGEISFGSYEIDINYVTISSTGNALDFGDLTQARGKITSFSSSTRGVWAQGELTPAGSSNVIDYVTISSTGNAANFGDLLATTNRGVALSNATRGIISGGTPTNLQYVTIASTGNAVDFNGNFTQSRSDLAGFASPTRGVFAGGFTPTIVNTVDFITISTLGNAADFGDLTVARMGMDGCSNSTRGLVMGGYNAPAFTADVTIDYVTISTLGNATNFGDLITAGGHGAFSSSTRAVALPGGNVMEYVTIMSTGNAIDFGDTFNNSAGYKAGCSNAHGGL